MNAEQWARVKDVFHAALDHGAADRPAFLAGACGGDSPVRAEVERLLAAHVAADGFLEQSPAPGTRPSFTDQTLGRYEIGRLLGSGGMGEVYLARDVELQREVAIKFGFAADAGSRLRREARHASRLNHPHVCTIHEVGESDGHAYIVMEYVAGDRLQDVIPPAGLPSDEVLRYGAQIAAALAHAHTLGVIHRDLKSANVVVTRDGRVKVLDFGLARGTVTPEASGVSQPPTTVTAPGLVTGTLAYMAPELLRGAPANESSDIWALGVVLYEMARGTRPFDGATGFELTAAILHEPVAPLPPHTPEALQLIVNRSLSKEPAERYQHADEVRLALQAVPSEQPASPPQAGWSDGGRRRPWMSRGRWAVAAGLVVLAAAGILAWRSIRISAPVGVGAAGRPAIAVMSFDNLAGGADTAWLSQGVPSMLLTGLAQTRGLDIVSTQRLREVVKQMGGTLETARRDQVAEIARRAGAGAIVVGGISKAGAEIRIDAQMEDLATGRILAAQSVRGTDLFLLVDQLTARIRDDVGFGDSGEIRRVSDISTVSLPAFRLYLQGVDEFLKYRWDDARSLLERAVEIDPSFADAYLHLAHVHFFLGRYALQEEYLRKAADHVDRLGARQRLVLDAESARAAGDGAKAARALDELMRAFPDDEDGYNLAFQLYAPVSGLIHDPQKLLITQARGAAAVPQSSLTRNQYAYALLFTGRHEDAIREFENNVQLAGREVNPHDSLGEAYLVAGAPEKAIESYARALAIAPDFFGSHQGRAWGLAMLGRFDEALEEGPPLSVKAFLLSRVGRYREASRVFDNARREAEVGGNIDEQGALFLLSAQLAIERKDYGRAAQDCDAAERVFVRLPNERQRAPRVLVHTLRGIAQVGAGRIGEARRHSAAQAREFNAAVEPENWWHHALEGEIALAGGDPAGAAAAFAAGQPARRMWFGTLRMSLTILANHLVSRDGLARVAKAQGDPARAIQIYKQLLAFGPEQKFVPVFEPRYELQIGRLLEQAGEGRGALRAYERFLELWRNADAGLPELGEARGAVARLMIRSSSRD